MVRATSTSIAPDGPSSVRQPWGVSSGEERKPVGGDIFSHLVPRSFREPNAHGLPRDTTPEYRPPLAGASTTARGIQSAKSDRLQVATFLFSLRGRRDLNSSWSNDGVRLTAIGEVERDYDY